MSVISLIRIFMVVAFLTTSFSFEMIRSISLLDIRSRLTTNEKKYSEIIRSSCKRRRMPPVKTALQEFEAFSNAYTGGTVGVMSIMFLLEIKKVQDQQLEGCPYCMGNGEILCARCLGSGSEVDNSNTECKCENCNGRGLVMCITCKGDGRNTPIILQSRAVRDPEYASGQSVSIDSP